MLASLLLAVQFAGAPSVLPADTLTLDAVRTVIHVMKQLDSIETKSNPDSGAKKTSTVKAALDSAMAAVSVVQNSHDTTSADSVAREKVAVLWAAMLDTMPKMRSVITAAGLTPIQYTRLSLRVYWAWGMVSMVEFMREQIMREQGEDIGMPDLPGGHDVAFVRAHLTEIRSWMPASVVRMSFDRRCAYNFVRPATDSAPPPATVTSRLALRALGALRADTPAVRRVVLTPGERPLAEQLVRAIATADSAGELAVVHMSSGSKVFDDGSPICDADRELEQALALPALAVAFRGVRVIQVSPPDWDDALAPFGYCKPDTNPENADQLACPTPAFYVVNAGGKALDDGLVPAMAQDAKTTAQTAAPQLAAYFAAARARRNP